MTLENLVVYGGMVLGFWAIGTITLLATGHRHRTVLDLGARRGAGAKRHAPGHPWSHRLHHAFGHR
jgi:hypothetical protein